MRALCALIHLLLTLPKVPISFFLMYNVAHNQMYNIFDLSLPAMVYIEKRTVRTTLEVGALISISIQSLSYEYQ